MGWLAGPIEHAARFCDGCMRIALGQVQESLADRATVRVSGSQGWHLPTARQAA